MIVSNEKKIENQFYLLAKGLDVFAEFAHDRSKIWEVVILFCIANMISHLKNIIKQNIKTNPKIRTSNVDKILKCKYGFRASELFVDRKQHAVKKQKSKF